MLGYNINNVVDIILSIWTVFALLFGYIIYKWSTATYDTFAKRGVKFIPPVPLFGNFFHVIFKTKNFSDVARDLYNYYPKEKFFGIFEMRSPLFLIKDPELIKQMAVKDFDHFLNHRINLDETHDPLLGRSLLFLKGQRWKDMRSTLGPAFTSSKMRTMFQLISECSSATVDFLEKEVKDGKPLLTDMKDLFTRFTTNVIATCAFGIKVDSLNEKDNQLYKFGRKITNFSGIRGLYYFALFHFPILYKIFGISLFEKEFHDFFRNLVWDTIHHRERENIYRPDMINLLIEARKGTLQNEEERQETLNEGFAVVQDTKIGEVIHERNLVEDDLTAQCLNFFLAGSDTTSSSLCFTAHELAVNPEVQKKLLLEVDATRESLGGKPLTYEVLQNMKYLDMVMSESLRYWPAGIITDRKCVKPYTIRTDEISCDVNVGETIFIPIVSIHHDPQYFLNPSRFDPERFSEENKHKINPFTYIPFGVGPRNCIGSRFALMETKAIIYYILTKFTFEVSEKTQVPLKVIKSGFFLKPEKGFWLYLKESPIVALIFSKWSVLIAVLGYFVYKWSTATYDTFKRRNLKFIPPVPLLGNFRHMVLQTKSFSDAISEMYNYFPTEKFYGIFEFRRPLFLVRDPELIKQIAVKDFDHFLDHRLNLDETHDPLFGRNLLSLKGQRWKDMRSTLSPAFTGSKMRTMFQLVSECSSATVDFLEKDVKNGKPILMEMKDLFTRFTNDVIATCAFGIKVDSFHEKNNQFYEFGKKASDFSGIRSLYFFMLLQFPTISKALGISLFTKEFSSFFRNLVWDTIHHRERENIYRPDMINLLIQARKGKLHHEEEGQESLSEGFAVVQETKIGEAIHQSKFVDDDLTAQCLIFFLAGFDTSSTCMCFTAHELAVNPEVQKKLLLEVDATRESLGGKPLTYEALQKMTYLDMVISESLRYWPPGVATDRKCVKPYRIKTDEISCDVKVGEAILIPIVSLHHDPKYFPNPSRFDPERFSEENKHKINPFAYLPFGVGPRNCIGSRFALMETKAIIYYILTKFTFEVSEKTQVPLKLAKAGFALKPEKGFWVDLKPRNL
ncbi:uncharacterized protein LOC129799506 [Phlebotomus papatasi]|uniref:uncharacterized protein LOC129799506 n=1 Tax=Phlebotomus papatasi TaxID=29031 RepID=UPI0024836DEB|nr:uncharacterized protein LOC129799506 [Phlebotomus papatasi]